MISSNKHTREVDPCCVMKEPAIEKSWKRGIESTLKWTQLFVENERAENEDIKQHTAKQVLIYFSAGFLFNWSLDYLFSATFLFSSVVFLNKTLTFFSL